MATATADPITLKLDRMFTAVDSDGDGFADWSDFQRIVDRFLTGYGIAKEDRRARALTAGYQMYWLELLRHADGKDRLSREQFIETHRLASVDTSRFNLVEGLSHAVFDVMDSDGDNGIGRSEFQQYLTVWGIAHPDAVDTFDRLDLDGDGCVSRQEFLRATREFHYSSDLNAPGSLLFGPIAE
ncbi:EF-hand domain-containing protein [Streptomyces sp. NPDC049881]|uniref:EF-hand domain-containing protein n=1 Tax=Streptomyces sp. NPDC049881 TaxID=3155778 RepID=UPI003443C853